MKYLNTIIATGLLLFVNSTLFAQDENIVYEPMTLPHYTPLVDSTMVDNQMVVYNAILDDLEYSNPTLELSVLAHIEPSDFTRASADMMSESRQFSNLVAADQIGVLTDYPIRTVVKLNITMYNPVTGQISYSGCSGVMVGDNEVLTAGHCVDMGGNNPSYATAITVVPAYNLSNSPFGSAQMTQWVSFTQWMDNNNWNYDIAMIKLNQPIGNLVGWLGFGYQMNNAFFTNPSNAFHSFGYPAQNDAGQTVFEGGERMYYMNGFIDYFESANSMCHYNIGYHGQSGSGLYFNDNSNRVVYGVLSHGSNQVPNTCHTRIDDWMFNQFLGFYDVGSATLAEDPSLETINISPNPSISGEFVLNLQGNAVETVEVFNSSGLHIITVLCGNENEVTLDLSEFSSGVYYCSFITQNSLIREKLIKL